MKKLFKELTDFNSVTRGEFGYSPTSPIPVRGKKSVEEYLDELKLPNGNKISWKRIGRKKAENLVLSVVEYEILDSKGRTLGSLYFYPHSKYRTYTLPEGYWSLEKDFTTCGLEDDTSPIGGKFNVYVFSAEWCEPCDMLLRDFESAGFSQYTIMDIDDEKNKELVTKYRIRSIPRVIVTDDTGRIHRDVVGYDEENPGQIPLINYLKNLTANNIAKPISSYLELYLRKVDKVGMGDGKYYSGWGYYGESSFVPHGCGTMQYPDYYARGNYIEGNLNGPVFVNHQFYMYAFMCRNNRGNGWGIKIMHDYLIEFGYYKDSQLANNLTNMVEWYYDNMMSYHRSGNMLNVYHSNETKQLSLLLIGYKAQAPYSLMGFRFMPDGSLWVGNSDGQLLSGKLIHFRPDGQVDTGEFEKGVLIKRMSLKEVALSHYHKDDWILYPNKVRGIPFDISGVPEIEVGYNYFS